MGWVKYPVDIFTLKSRNEALKSAIVDTTNTNVSDADTGKRTKKLKKSRPKKDKALTLHTVDVNIGDNMTMNNSDIETLTGDNRNLNPSIVSIRNDSLGASRTSDINLANEMLPLEYVDGWGEKSVTKMLSAIETRRRLRFDKYVVVTIVLYLLVTDLMSCHVTYQCILYDDC